MAPDAAGGPWHIVITGAKSRSHLVHIAAYLREILEDPDVTAVKVSFVESEAFLSAPRVTVSDLESLLPTDSRVTLCDGFPGYVFDSGAHAVYVSVGAPGIGMLVRLLRAGGRRRFGVVVTDEGIGTYGSFFTRRSAMLRQGVAVPTATLKAGVIAGVARIFTTTRWAAYRRAGGQWRVTPRIAEEFRRYVRGAVPGTRPRAVVLTQPFADLGLMDVATQLNYVDALCDALRAVGLDPVIRPHPAEDVVKYGARPLMSTRGTAELDPDVVESALVVGGPSTALVNVSAMYGSRVLWVSIPGLEELDTRVSRRQAAILHAFLGCPIPLAAVPEALKTLNDEKPFRG